jgi:ADP-heptose:LPS heptosyltransferase
MRILIVRLGAYGDVIITTPLVRHLATAGNEIVYMTSERGMEVLQGNPHIKKLILHPKDSVPIEKLGDRIKEVAKKHGCERTIDLCESIEVALSLHPRSPEYNLPKYERRARYERNFYEYTMEWAGVALDILPYEPGLLRPELFFTDKEVAQARSHLKPGFNLLVGMSGSGTNKTYPWTEALCGSIMKDYGDKVHIITVGDERCQIIEPIGPTVTNLAGKLPMRVSMAMTGLVQCVISPDTGLLHAAGAYPTPKIGILGHNTREVITKHFLNDYSVEADANLSECAPCFRLIYNMKLQCPIDPNTGGAYCMSKGIRPELVYQQFQEVYDKHEKGS